MDSEKDRQRTLVVTSTVLTGLSTWIIGMRLLTRHFVVHSLGKDDLMMALGWLFTVGYLIEIYLLSKYGVGMKSSQISMSQTVDLMKTTLALEMNYYVIIFFIKTSIVFFYLRLSNNEIFRKLCYGTALLLAIFGLCCVAITLGQCIPLHSLWDFAGTVHGKCINTTAFFYSTSAFNIITDFWILSLPINPLRKIDRPGSEKIALYIIFGVGVFACIASIIRLHTIYLFTLSKDPFHDAIQVNLWSMIEVNTAIFCASVPALRPLLSKAHRDRAFSEQSCNPRWPRGPCSGRDEESRGSSSFSEKATMVAQDLKFEAGRHFYRAKESAGRRISKAKLRAESEMLKARPIYASVQSRVRPNRADMIKEIDIGRRSTSEERILYPTRGPSTRRPSTSEERVLYPARRSTSEERVLYQAPSPELHDPRIGMGRFHEETSDWKDETAP